MSWTRIDNDVLDRIPTSRAIAVYVVLRRFADTAGKCWPKLDTVAAAARMKRHTVLKGIADLEEAGIVRVARKPGAGNTYHLLGGAEMGTGGVPKTARVPVPKTALGSAESGTPKEQEPKNQTKKNKKVLRYADDDAATARWMLSLVQTVDPKAKANLGTWANVIRLMRERDGRTDDEIRATFAWANQDYSFWRAKCLSPGNLKKNFTRLIAEKERANGKLSAAGPGHTHIPGRTTDDPL